MIIIISTHTCTLSLSHHWMALLLDNCFKTAFGDVATLSWTLIVCLQLFYPLKHFCALYHLADDGHRGHVMRWKIEGFYSPKGNIASIHPGSCLESDVELGIVCIWTFVGHSQNTSASVGHSKALVFSREIADSSCKQAMYWCPIRDTLRSHHYLQSTFQILTFLPLQSHHKCLSS